MAAQLATLVDDAPNGDGWLHEIKFDGYRMLCRIDDGRCRMFSRTGKEWTASFPGIAGAAARLPVESAWIDGERWRWMLRGRRNELGVLERQLRRTRAGESSVLVVRGEAGVGKTALLEYIAERASGCRIVRVAGVEWQRPKIKPRFRTSPAERQTLAVGRKRIRHKAVLALQQPLRFSGSIRANPLQRKVFRAR